MIDYQNKTILIGDDASTDDSIDIIKKIDGVEFYQNIENIGISKNYVKGFSYSVDYDYFINIDSDDYFVNKKWVAASIKAMKIHKYPIFQGKFKSFDKIKPSEIIGKIDKKTYIISGYEYLRHTLKYFSFSHQCVIINVSKSKEFEPYKHGSLYCDFFHSAKIAIKYGVIVSSRNIVKWRKHSQNQSSKLEDKINELNKIELEYYRLLEWLENYLNYYQIKVISKLIETKIYDKKLKLYSKSKSWNKVFTTIKKERIFNKNLVYILVKRYFLGGKIKKNLFSVGLSKKNSRR